MLEARFVPLEKWPGRPTAARRNAPFQSTYLKTLDLLESELRWLNAHEVVIQADFSRSQLRNDGWPKAGAVPNSPGVILGFETDVGPLSFPCDTFLHFEDNVRAIALSLEALRKIDRYGVTRQAEQYKGWQQLAEPGATPHFSGAEQAAAFIVLQAFGQHDEKAIALVLRDSDQRKHVYRRAAYHAHPDRGGNPEQFHLLQEALAILEAK